MASPESKVEREDYEGSTDEESENVAKPSTIVQGTFLLDITNIHP